MKRILLILVLFLVGCAQMRTLGPYSIGRDPSWYPLRLRQATPNVNGFTNGLVAALAHEEGKPFRLIDVRWNQLIPGLEAGDYAGIFTSLTPNLITKESYTFSDPFLKLGPVLVVPVESDAESLTDLANTTVGAYQYDSSVLIVQKHPSIVIKLYEQVPQAFEEILSGDLHGALVPNLEARALIDTLYAGRLKIVTPPLDNKALRLITLKGHHEALIEHFNVGLKKLEKQSNYWSLRRKFKVD